MSIHTFTGVPGFACLVALLTLGMRVPAAHAGDMAFEFNADGVLPSSQGAVFNGNPAGYLETDFFSVSGDLLRQDTTQWGYINATYSVPGVFDHSQDAVLEFRAKLIETTYWPRGGVTVVLFSDDRFWEIDLGDAYIWCRNGDNDIQVQFNTRDDFHVYRLVIPANRDVYEVYVDGTLVFTGSAGSWVPEWPPELAGLLYWGDGSEGNAVIDWDYVRLTNHVPGAQMLLFGGPGDQLGLAVAVQGSQVIVSGQSVSPTSGGLLRSYEIPLGVTYQWSLVQSLQYPASLATTATNLYASGTAHPPACGASDGVGDTEGKVEFAIYSLFGTPVGCWSYNFFPYTGGEHYVAAAASNEGGSDYIYAGGSGEQVGGGYSGPMLLVKYDTAGTMVNKVTEPGIGWGYPPFRVGVSGIDGLAVLNGHVYAAGGSALTGFGEDQLSGGPDNGERPVLMKYDFDLNRIWKSRADPTATYPGYGGSFHGVATLDGYVYAVGGAVPSGGTHGVDYLVEKFDQGGNRVWSASWGGAYDDVLRGVIAVGDRLFAVGYMYKTSHAGYDDGDADAVLFEISPIDGSILMSDVFGGDRVDWARGVATDGHDLYIVGQTRSYASGEGNVVGQNEIMLIHYPLNRPPVADDQSVSADWGVAKDIELTASDEDGDTLTYSIVEPPAHGTLTGDTPNLTYTSSCTYYGPDSFTFKVNDGTEDSNIATVSITVQKTYAFTGFRPPIDNTPVVNSAKAGSVIPVLWRITDLCGAPISDPTSFKSLTSNSTTCGTFTGDPVDELETYAGSSGLQYFGEGNWQYNWKTPKNYAPQCRIMVLTLLDGSAHTAYFKFK